MDSEAEGSDLFALLPGVEVEIWTAAWAIRNGGPETREAALVEPRYNRFLAFDREMQSALAMAHVEAPS